LSSILFLISRYSLNGTIHTKFLALQNVHDAGAESLTATIKDALNEYGGLSEDEVRTKLIGFGADGASVNMGSVSGIGIRLSSLQPLITSVHCMAHRLELVFKDVINDKTLASKFRILPFLEGLYSFYHRSSKNTTVLAAAAKMEEVTGKPTRIGGTRWVPHLYLALSNFWKLQAALKRHFSEVSILLSIQYSPIISLCVFTA
jgi:hypothetical protein